MNDSVDVAWTVMSGSEWVVVYYNNGIALKS
jgi:hypothetical protein